MYKICSLLMNLMHCLVQMNETFVDTSRIAIHRKIVQPVDQQGEFESRRLVMLRSCGHYLFYLCS